MSGSTAEPSRLPIAMTSFVGRESELALLQDLLRRDDVRLLTIRGPGGVGKTRLTVQAASALQSAFPDGLHFVALSPVDDCESVPLVVSRALGLTESAGKSAAAALLEHLAAQRALLILDTFEHLLPAGAFVMKMLVACPSLTVAVTSRSPLNLSGEQEFPVEPLPVPGERDVSHLASLAAVPAIALFVQRARAINPSFALAQGNAATVAEICRCLDGLPLAIELAAARTRVFPPQALLARLNERFEILHGGPQDAPARHGSLWATLDWSFQLLGPRERQVFPRLAVFAGGWTLHAAERVCGDGSLTAQEIAEAIDALLQSSLIQQQDPTGSEPRYVMLDTIRSFAFEHLKDTGERFPLQRKHARYFAEVVQDASSGLRGDEQERWLQRLDADYLNVRAALAWSLQYDLETGVRLVIALCYFWYMHGHSREGRRWVEAALERAPMDGNDLEPALYGGLLNSAGVLAWQMGDYREARQLLAGAVTLRRTTGDPAELSASLTNLGNVFCRLGDFERGMQLFEESLAIGREMGDTWDIAAGLNNLGNVAEAQEDDAKATELYDESLSLFREIGDEWNAAIALNNLGSIANRKGDLPKALQLLEESVSIFRSLNDPWSTATVLSTLSHTLIRAGRFAEGRDLADESLRLFRQVGDTGQIPEVLETLGLAAGALQDIEKMTRLLAAAAGRRATLAVPPSKSREEDIAQALAAARDQLSQPRFDEVWAHGHAMTLEEAIAFATEAPRNA